MSIHVYHLEDWQRKSQLLALPKLENRPQAECITEVLLEQLTTRLNVTKENLVRRITMGAADGAKTLQGNASGVLLRVREAFAPWSLQGAKAMRCMAHRIDLCAEAINECSAEDRVVDLLRAVYALFARSPNRSQLLTRNQHLVGSPFHYMLRVVATRWISHWAPLDRFLQHISALLLTAYNIKDGLAGTNFAAGQGVIGRMTKYCTLLAAAAMRHVVRVADLQQNTPVG